MFEANVNEFRNASRGTLRLATEEEEREAKEGERGRREAAKAWSCNHCYDYLGLGKTESFPVIRGHLKNKCVFQTYAYRIFTHRLAPGIISAHLWRAPITSCTRTRGLRTKHRTGGLTDVRIRRFTCMGCNEAMR